MLTQKKVTEIIAEIRKTKPGYNVDQIWECEDFYNVIGSKDGERSKCIALLELDTLNDFTKRSDFNSGMQFSDIVSRGYIENDTLIRLITM